MNIAITPVLGAFDFLTRNDWFVISLFLVTMSYFLFRPRRFSSKAQGGDRTLESIRDSYDRNSRETVKNANRVEVKLFEYEREVEGRMQTRLAVLDQLILESERKIEMLQRVLDASRQETPRQEKQGIPTSSGRGEVQVFTTANDRRAGGTSEESPRADAA